MNAHQSMIAALLNRPTIRPAASPQCNQAMAPRALGKTPAQIADAERNAKTRATNIEHVFKTIAAGVDTIPKLVPATGLSRSTVYFAIEALEDWPGGSRTERIKGPTHRFTVKIEKEKESC